MQRFFASPKQKIFYVNRTLILNKLLKGLVFGKFYPFHKGHEALIDFALSNSDTLIVLVCASDKESITGRIRQDWIEKHYPKHPKIQVQLFEYKESELPNSSESSREISAIWTKVFQEVVPSVDIIFSSEPYGEFVAEAMSINFQNFDLAREQVPISATKIRENPFQYWEYLPQVVQPYFVKKIVLLGTESTGKTTLTEKLANAFQTNFVLEQARQIEKVTDDFTFEDLQTVVQIQTEAIQKAKENTNKLLFIDTNLLITLSYSQFLFGKKLEVNEEVYQANQADIYFYLDKDAPFIQDGTRLSENNRNQLNDSHLRKLKEHQINYHLIQGNWEERFEKMKEIVSRYFQ